LPKLQKRRGSKGTHTSGKDYQMGPGGIVLKSIGGERNDVATGA